jgi:hypothetical protein
MPANPVAAGLFLDPPNDRMVVRVADSDVNRDHESWWVYRLSDGKAAGKYEPRSLMPEPESAKAIYESGREVNKSILDARPVARTSYTLVHWWCFEYNAHKRSYALGARFSLVDLQGKPVWKLDLPHDYEVMGDEKAEEAIRKSIRQNGAILRTDVPRRFDVQFVAAKKRVTFEVAVKENGEVNVRELERRPMAP